MSKAKKLYGAIIDAKLKNPQNCANIKNTIDDLPRDFATLDPVADTIYNKGKSKP
jgi:hypothetical protein